MFTLTTLATGALWTIKRRTWVVAQVDGPVSQRFRVGLIDPASGRQASARMPQVELFGRIDLPGTRTHTVKIDQELDGWPGYTPDAFARNETIVLAGHVFHVADVRDEPSAGLVEIELETDEVVEWRFLAELSRRRGDEAEHKRRQATLTRTKDQGTAYLYLPRRLDDQMTP